MEQCWLRPNSRTQFLESLPWIALLVGGLGVVYWGFYEDVQWLTWLGGAASLLAAAMLAIQAWLSAYPRLAYRDGYLLLYLPAPKPLEVPIGVVECFFIGQGPTLLPGVDEREVQAANVVVRLAEKATEWHHRQVPPLLASWCDGYIILRGVFCEPIDGDKVNHLNKLLAEVHREQKKAAQEAAP